MNTFENAHGGNMIWIFVAITIAATHYIAFKWGAIVTLQRCKADIAGMYDEAVRTHVAKKEDTSC